MVSSLDYDQLSIENNSTSLTLLAVASSIIGINSGETGLRILLVSQKISLSKFKTSKESGTAVIKLSVVIFVFLF